MIRRIRIAANLGRYTDPQDVLTSQALTAWRGSALQVDLAFFRRSGSPPADELLEDAETLGAIESVHLTLKARTGSEIPEPETEPAVAASTSDITPDLTLEQWTGLTGQHASLSLTAAQMSIAAGSYWATIWALLESGERSVLGAGSLALRESSLSEPGEPPEPPVTWITVAEGDLRWLRRYEHEGVEITAVSAPSPDVRGLWKYAGQEHQGFPVYSKDVGGTTYYLYAGGAAGTQWYIHTDIGEVAEAFWENPEASGTPAGSYIGGDPVTASMVLLSEAALEAAVEATAAATSAATDAGAAANAAGTATAASIAAGTARDEAQAARDTAVDAQSDAETARDAAQAAQAGAEAAETDAETHAGNAAASAAAANVPASTNPRALAGWWHFSGVFTSGAANRVQWTLGPAGAGLSADRLTVQVLLVVPPAGSNGGLFVLGPNNTDETDNFRGARLLAGTLEYRLRAGGAARIKQCENFASTYEGQTVLITFVETAAAGVKLYINGVDTPWTEEVTSGSPEAWGAGTLASTYFSLGIRTNNYWAGRIGDASLYNRALTQAQIIDYMRHGPAFADVVGSQVTRDAGTLAIGKRYRITARDASDFTAVGAADNTVGTEFVATGTGAGLLDASNTVIQIGLLFVPVITRSAQVDDGAANRIRGLVAPAVTPISDKVRPIRGRISATGYLLADQGLWYEPHYISAIRVKPTTATIPTITIRRTDGSGTTVAASQSTGAQDEWTELTLTAAGQAGAAGDKLHITFDASAAEIEYAIDWEPL